MKKKVVLGLLALFGASIADAGVQTSQDIYVEHGEDYAYAQGDLTTVRFSDNDAAFIGCGTRTIILENDTVYTFGFCQAGSMADEYVACSTEDPAMLDAIRSLDGTSFVGFNADANGTCDFIATSTQSVYLDGSKDTKR